MQQSARLNPPRFRALSPLAWSLLLSLIVHALLFSTIELGNRFDLWRFSPFALVAKWLGAKTPDPTPVTPTTTTTLSAEPEAREIPMVFVDVDPSQATTEAPPNTPYYSPVNSLAADSDPVDDQLQPRLDGKQDKVLKTLETERSAAAIPLQPSQPQEAQPPSKAGEPKPQVAERLTPDPTPAEKQLAKVEPIERPLPRRESGNFEAAKPPPKTEPAATPVPSGTGIEQRERPRTLAAARSANNLNPHSALTGEKFKQEGGVKRFNIQSSLNVAGSPFGNYDARFISIVQQTWYQLLDEQRFTLDRVGKVVLRFKMSFDGRIKDMETVESNVGEIYTLLCQMAVTKPAPYDKWPTEMRKMVREDYREVMFTFFY